MEKEIVEDDKSEDIKLSTLLQACLILAAIVVLLLVSNTINWPIWACVGITCVLLLIAFVRYLKKSKIQSSELEARAEES